MDQQEIIQEVKRTIQMEAEAVKTLLDTVDMEKVAAAVEKIGTMKGKVVAAGCGTSAMGIP